MAVKITLACGLQKSIAKLWEDNQYSDLTVVVGDTSFPCHRLILGACSVFFQRLFRSQLKECLDGCVTLDRLSEETFNVIINSIYKGTDGLTEENVFDVWSAAELLQIDYLIQECKEFIKCHISVDNCFRYLNHTMAFWPHVMCYTCLNFIASNFEEVKNADSFLQLPFLYFHKIISSDSLAVSSEDSVVETIIKWVEYVPGTLNRHAGNAVADISSYSVATGGKREKGNSDQDKEDGDQVRKNIGPDIFSRLHFAEFKSVSIPRTSDSTGLDRLQEFVKLYSDLKAAEARHHHGMVPPGERAAASVKQVSSIEDRKQQFLKLISACKLFLTNSVCLENLLRNRRDLLISTGTYDLVLNAVLYTLSVGRRHDSWPEGAVHRDSSSSKHVMVFFSKNKFKAYELSTGTFHGLAKVPEDYHNKYANGRMTVFDNVLYFMYECRDKGIKFNVLTKQKEWALVNDRSLDACSRKLLLAHGNYIYNFKVENNNFMLCRYSCIHGDTGEWTKKICVSKTTKNCLIRFQKYIVVFGTNKNVVTACFYNTETEKTHMCNISMDGTSQDMMSFRVGEDVYIIQRNGSLWKIFSTETAPVNFELISKLWDFDCSLRGCVLYRKKLFIFCNEPIKSSTLQPFLPGIYVDIEIIQINCRTHCVPMVLPQAWLD